MIKIIHLDSCFLAAEKPSGLLTVPGRGLDKQDCLIRRVQLDFPDVRLVHRLDMGTSGLVLFARTLEAQRALSKQFEQRKIKKSYQACVEGILKKENGWVAFPLRKDMTQRLPPRHLVDCIRGKKAFTRWKVLERCEDKTRVALFPETGRSHQLRVHMFAIGHPIVGDPIYGTPEKRLMLHAHTLQLIHPENGKEIFLESPVPF